MNNAITTIQSTACPIIGDHIDTDQIIPARYLTAISFNGIEEGLFYDLRFDKDQKSKNFVTDDKAYAGHEIYIVGSNFGCGSSREHAPQAIKRSGIKAIIGSSYSEIFFGNSVSIGLPCFTLEEDQIKSLQDYVKTNPRTNFVIDMRSLTLSYDGLEINLQLPSTAQELFLKGTFDPLNVLLSNTDKIKKFEQNLSL